MARSVNHRILLGLILVALGALFLFDNYDIISFDIPYWVFRWQSILIVIGLLITLNAKNKTAGFVLIVVGTLGFFPELWPLLLIGLGIYLLYKKQRNSSSFSKGPGEFGNWEHHARHHHHEHQDSQDDNREKEFEFAKDTVNDVAIFSGQKKIVQSQNFKGGNLTAVFGGSEIDLSECKLAKGENTLDVFTMFGGFDLVAPRNWKIHVEVLPIFGGFKDKRMILPEQDMNYDGILVIKGVALFGGGSIKS